MTDDKRDELIIDMHGKVTQMYGVLYENGLVAKVERHEETLRNGYLTCPVGDQIRAHLQDHKDRRYSVPVWVVVLIGVVGLLAPLAYHALGVQ